MAHGSPGFTLIETLVALGIFGIMSMAITSLMVTNTRMVSENRQSSEAIGYAQGLLENLREVPVATLSSGTSTRTSPGGTNYTVTWTVTPDTPASGRTEVRVTVGWNYKGSPRTYATHTIFTQLSS